MFDSEKNKTRNKKVSRARDLSSLWKVTVDLTQTDGQGEKKHSEGDC